MPKPKIPDAAIKRLPVYLRVLEETAAQDVQIISSAELAEKTGFSPEQIRKDLAYFGAFGTRGVGYDTQLLGRRISRILGLHKGIRAALVGAGHLGFALARYSISRHKDVRITAIFDADPQKIGTEIMGITIQPISELAATVKQQDIKIGIITVPAPEAQATAEQLAAAGAEAILNFAPKVLAVPDNVEVRDIDLSTRLEILTFYLCMKDQNG